MSVYIVNPLVTYVQLQLSIYTPACICLSVSLSMSLFLRLTVCLSVCLSVVCLSVCLSVSLINPLLCCRPIYIYLSHTLTLSPSVSSSISFSFTHTYTITYTYAHKHTHTLCVSLHLSLCLFMCWNVLNGEWEMFHRKILLITQSINASANELYHCSLLRSVYNFTTLKIDSKI